VILKHQRTARRLVSSDVWHHVSC